ncbi:UNVERIFIED_CONTAM: hypothetical protein GTU68_011353 [Idotea baltica]|nr:hypothetical protein [Idotea baltica]
MEEDQRPQFGNRYLNDKSQVFTHNAWDNVEWDEEQEATAQKKVSENSEIKFSEAEIDDLHNSASIKWNKFYSIHQNRFFKDRHWLFTEFSELDSKDEVSTEPNSDSKEALNPEDKTEASTDLAALLKKLRKEESYPGEKSSFKIWEVGCGVGNTVFPILEKNADSNLFVYCCDFSSTAIDIVKESENYNADRCHAFVCDLAAESLSTPFPQNSVDVIVCIFVLSALQPVK